MSCLAAKPVVDGIEKDLEGRARVIRLNLMSRIGREVAARYGVQVIPTLVVLDGEEQEIYRYSGVPNREEVVAQLVTP